MGIIGTSPEPNEIEVSVFGPGYGECCLIHFGGGWMIIDSCIDVESGRPAVLRYLEAIGVNPAQAVKLIVASHWHDDHIRGLSAIVKACEQARFCASSALNTKEFVCVLAAYEQNKGIQAGSGAREIIATLRVLQEREPASHPLRALASTRLLQVDGGATGHGHPVEVWSLCPSSAQFDQFLIEIGTLFPTVGAPKVRATPTSPNHLAIVIWVSIGSVALLFGADLEETGNPNFGWSAIVASQTKPAGTALFFKIPHHGSRTAHHLRAWQSMVRKDAACVLTPWRFGRVLPTRVDVQRILEHTERGYSTADLRSESKAKRPYPVEKQIKETTRLKQIATAFGHVQFRCRLTDGEPEHTIELSTNACKLEQLLTVLT